jgi:hypothetical protein
VAPAGTGDFPAAIVIACIYIPINLALSWAATWLERRNRRRQIAAPAAADAELAMQHGKVETAVERT